MFRRRTEPEFDEASIEPFSKLLGDRAPFLVRNEHELAAFDLPRDARKYLVVLRQVLEQRLATPVHDRAFSESQTLAADGGCSNFDRFVIDRQVREANEPFRVVIICVRRLHEVAAQKVIYRREAGG